MAVDVEAQKKRRTHCPSCGARLPEQPLSICSYCAMPLELASSAKAAGADGESPNAGKIARILEQPAYSEALDFHPPESRAFQLAAQRALRAKLLLGLSLAPLVFALLFGEGPLHTRVGTWAALALAILATLQWFRAQAVQRREVALPLLKRPGMILDRRSETSLRGWGGSTCYYFQIEFQDGVCAEFAYPGHGSNEEPYTNGLTGVAYTRGKSLLHFKHVRV